MLADVGPVFVGFCDRAFRIMLDPTGQAWISLDRGQWIQVKAARA